MANKFFNSLNESLDKKLFESYQTYQEWWGQVDEDPFEFADEFNLTCKKIKSNNDETLYEFSGDSEDFEAAKKAGYFYSMNEGLREALKTVFRSLNEAEISDDDRRDSEVIRNLYKKIAGKKYTKFTPEEQDVMDKFGLDAWGFRGDTKVITPKANNVVNSREFNSKWKKNKQTGEYSYHTPADKINYADRARKVDSRDWGRKYNNSIYLKSNPNEEERRLQAWDMQRPYNDLKYAKSDYKHTKKNLDDYYDNMAKSISNANDKYDKDLDKIEKDYSWSKNYHNNEKNQAQDKINNLLAKHRKKIQDCLESLNERLIDVSDELQQEFEELIKSFGFEIEDKGKTWMGRVHYQIILPDSPVDEDEIEELATPLINAIDRFDHENEIPITWSFGLNKDGMLTAGIDLDKQWVNESLNEASMSDEDRRDSDLLKGILRKIDARSNAKLSDEEKAVLNKYGLSRTNSGFRKDNDWLSARSLGLANKNSEYNLADKTRKLDRDYGRQVRNYDSYWNKDTFQDLERKKDAAEMSRDVDDMKSALQDRSYHTNAYQDEVEKEQTAKVKAAADRDASIRNITSLDRLNSLKDRHQKNIDKLNDVRKKYNLPIRDSLKEGYGDHLTRVIPTKGDPKLNSAIIGSVIGQLSDGIWENSPGMKGYWYTANEDDNGNILIDDRGWINERGDRPFDNRYAKMSDDEVLKYFVNKAKYIAQLYMHDNNINPYKGWRADNDEECGYMNGYSYIDHDPTIGEIFTFVKNNK